MDKEIRIFDDDIGNLKIVVGVDPTGKEELSTLRANLINPLIDALKDKWNGKTVEDITFDNISEFVSADGSESKYIAGRIENILEQLHEISIDEKYKPLPTSSGGAESRDIKKALLALKNDPYEFKWNIKLYKDDKYLKDINFDDLKELYDSIVSVVMKKF